MNILKMLVVIDNALALLNVLRQAIEDRLVVLPVLAIHVQHLLHLFKDGLCELSWLTEEQIVHVMHEELHELVFEDRLLHLD